MSRLTRLVGLLAFFAVISLGIFVWPESMLDVEERSEGLVRQAAGLLLGLLYLVIWFAVPLLLVVVLFGSEATGRRIVALLGLLIWVVGLGLPVVIVGASVGSTTEQFVMSTLKALSLFLLVVGGREVALLFAGRSDAWSRRITAIIALLLAGFSAWSLVSAGAAVASARAIAGEAGAYCIADTRSRETSYRQIGSLFALRGVDLVVEKSGVEASKRHYFHALLYRPEGPGPRYWNWSASRFHFEPLDPADLSASVVLPAVPCSARPGFLESLI